MKINLTDIIDSYNSTLAELDIDIDKLYFNEEDYSIMSIIQLRDKLYSFKQNVDKLIKLNYQIYDLYTLKIEQEIRERSDNNDT